MKNLLITATLVGIATALLIVYYTNDEESDIEDAAADSYDTMNKHIGHVERQTEKAFNDVFN